MATKSQGGNTDYGVLSEGSQGRPWSEHGSLILRAFVPEIGDAGSSLVQCGVSSMSTVAFATATATATATGTATATF